MRLAVIPARGGSKRVPRKNIRPFCGRPMIAWSIDAAIESGCFDRVVVSTDDAEIAKVAEGLGAEVPFMRPPHLADDMTATRPVIAHAVESLVPESDGNDLVCCLYATAPFVRPEDLRAGLERLLRGDAGYVFPVTTFAFPIQRALRMRTDGRISMFDPRHFGTRSQDLEEAWHDAGQFYWASARQWRLDEPLYGPKAAVIPVPRYRVQDIDTEEDWATAELLFRAIRLEE